MMNFFRSALWMSIESRSHAMPCFHQGRALCHGCYGGGTERLHCLSHTCLLSAACCHLSLLVVTCLLSALLLSKRVCCLLSCPLWTALSPVCLFTLLSHFYTGGTVVSLHRRLDYRVLAKICVLCELNLKAFLVTVCFRELTPRV
jgi:hypothetical protein